MKRTLLTWILIAAFACASAGQAADAADIDWPQKPITLILGWAQGGGADITSRAVFHPYVEKILGQKIIITNKTGAGGEISFVALAHSKPDGYTFGWTVTPNLVSFPVSRKTQYQLEDLEPVANITYDPGVFVVPNDSALSSLKDIVDYANNNPGKMTIGNGGTGGDDFIAVELFKQACNCDITQVPYAEGTGAQISGLLGKHIMVSAINATEALSYAEAGKVKILGVMNEERVDIIPEVPTFKEQGFDIVSGSFRGFSAPAGTPKPIIEKMASSVADTLKNPDFLKRANNLKLILKYKGPDEYKAFLYDFREKVKAIHKKVPW